MSSFVGIFHFVNNAINAFEVSRSTAKWFLKNGILIELIPKTVIMLL